MVTIRRGLPVYEGSTTGHGQVAGHAYSDSRGRHPQSPPPPPPPALQRHDPQWAEVRNQALERMLKMNSAHAMHAWERRRSVSPLGPHALAFLYYDVPGGAGRPHHLVVAAATRLFHDDEDHRDVHRLIFRLCKLADERYLASGSFDPRTTMANRSDPMSSQASFLGIGLSTLDTGTASWEMTQERASGPAQVPGRSLVILSDGSRMLIDREDDRHFGQVKVISTGDLNVVRGNPTRNWTPATAVKEPAETWQWLLQLGKLCDTGQQMMDERATNPPLPRQRRGN
jgi:hypothetical protein